MVVNRIIRCEIQLTWKTSHTLTLLPPTFHSHPTTPVPVLEVHNPKPPRFEPNCQSPLVPVPPHLLRPRSHPTIVRHFEERWLLKSSRILAEGMGQSVLGSLCVGKNEVWIHLPFWDATSYTLVSLIFLCLLCSFQTENDALYH
jgi:hypothetical protein